MDLSEKKKKLEAIRAAREAKQRIVDQYSSTAKASTSSAQLPTAPQPAPPPPAQASPRPTTAPTPPSPSSSSSPAAMSRRSSAVTPAAEAQPPSRRPEASSAAAESARPMSSRSLSDAATASKRTASPRMGSSQKARMPSPHAARPPMPQPQEPSAAPTQPAKPEERRHSQPQPHPQHPQRAPSKSQTHSYRQGLDAFRNWSRLVDRDAERGAVGSQTAAAGLTARCALAPKVCLGREGRLPVGIAVSCLPYRSEQQPQHGVEGSGRDAPAALDSAACVAVAYSAGSTNRDTSARSEGALVAETGFPWGTVPAAAFSSGTHRGATVVPLEKAARMSRCAPGLALAWAVIPGSAAQDDFAPPEQHRPEGGAMDAETAAIAVAATGATVDLVVLTPLLCDVELSAFVAHPFRPGVFIGGTVTGRIVMWQVAAEWVNLDRKQLRARAMATTGSAATLVWRPQRPCASSFPSPLSHQAPLLALAVHGDASSHYLYSISQDGKVATWPAWQPTEPLSFRTGYLGSKAMGFTGTAAAFGSQRGSDAMSKVYVGTVGGAVLEGFNRDSRVVELALCGGAACGSFTASESFGSSRQNLGVSNSTLGLSAAAPGGSSASGLHGGLVNAVAVQAPGDLMRECDCVVTAAVDGTCVAWLGDMAYRLENFTAPVTALAWSPTLTAFFAAGDEEGLVSLWNVFQSTAVSVASLSTKQVSMLQPGSSTTTAILAVGSNDGGAGGLDGGSLLSMAAAGNLTIVDPVEGASPAITSLSFSSDGQWLFAGTAAGNVFVLELGQGLSGSS